jgi:hypothetical protein
MQSRSGQLAQFVGEQSGPFGFDREGDPADTGSLRLAGQVLTGAGDQAAVITHGAWDQAAAIRQAAEQEAEQIRQQAASRAATVQREAADQAAAIQRAAEQEAAKMREHLLAMSGELGRVSAYVTDNLDSPGALATRPSPAIEPAQARAIAPPRPRTRPGAPAAAPAIAPPRPRTKPGAPAAAPAKPRTRPGAPAARPAGPRTTPAKNQGARGRQAHAMRIATAATVAMFSIAVIAAGANIAHFGFKFFTFRETGAGETGPNGGSDQDFLAKEAAAAKAAAQAHTPGKHSAKTTSG